MQYDSAINHNLKQFYRSFDWTHSDCIQCKTAEQRKGPTSVINNYYLPPNKNLHSQNVHPSIIFSGFSFMGCRSHPQQSLCKRPCAPSGHKPITEQHRQTVHTLTPRDNLEWPMYVFGLQEETLKWGERANSTQKGQDANKWPSWEVTALPTAQLHRVLKLQIDLIKPDLQQSKYAESLKDVHNEWSC